MSNNENRSYNNINRTAAGRSLSVNMEAANNYAYDCPTTSSSASLENVHLMPHTLANARTTNTATYSGANAQSHSINIELNNETAANNAATSRAHNGGQSIRQQFVTLFNEARTHFVQPNAVNQHAENQQQQPGHLAHNENNRGPNSQWRRNLNQIISMSMMPNSNNVPIENYIASNVPNNLAVPNPVQDPSHILIGGERAEISGPTQRRLSVNEHNNNNNNSSAIEVVTTQSAAEEDTSFFERETNNAQNAANLANAQNADEDAQRFSRLIIKVLTHLLRYMPFFCIIFIKFVHDHLLDIVDIIILQMIIYQVNKSLCEQIAKLSQKSYYILIRDFALVLAVVIIRFHFAKGVHDPFGLLITPPKENVVLLSNIQPPENLEDNNTNTEHADTSLQNTLQITQTLSLSLALFYVIINDLVLKLITILTKILITMLPPSLIQPKPRSRVFVLVEYVSQFYRAFAPMREWVTYLRASYKGFEATSGIIFCIMYLGAKGFEFVDRGKMLKKAIYLLITNRDTARAPTERELSAVDVCPICHDTFTVPVVIECGHIFCEDCVNTWLKREKTCPMCRALVRDEISFHDGSTTNFFQLF